MKKEDEFSIGQSVLDENSRTRVVKRLTVQPRIFQEIRMNRHLHLNIRIIRNPTRALIRKIVHIRRIVVGIQRRVIQLALRKHHQVAMELPSEGNVNVARLVHVWNGTVIVGEAADDLGGAVAEGVVGFGAGRDRLEAWVGDCGVAGVGGAVLTGEDQGGGEGRGGGGG